MHDPSAPVIHLSGEIAPHILVGGLGIAVARLVRQLAAAGATSRVLTGATATLWQPRREAWGEIVPLPLTGHRAARLGSLTEQAWRALADWRCGGDSMLVAHDDDCAALIGLARRRGFPGRLVYWLHSLYGGADPDMLPPHLRPAQHAGSLAADAIDAADLVAVSAGILADATDFDWPTRMRALQAALRRARDRGATLTVEAGQCLPPLAPLPTTEESPARPRVVFPSRVGVHKGAGIFLEIADRLRDLEVDFIGVGDPGVAGIDMRRPGAARIRWIPWQTPDALRALLRSAACVVVPSLSEGYGLSAAETAQLGVPLIYNDIGGLRSLPSAPTNVPIALTPGERAGLYTLWGDLQGEAPHWECWDRAQRSLGPLRARWVERVEHVLRSGEPARVAAPALSAAIRWPSWGEALLERVRA